MKLCFVADGRSSHARNWMQHLIGSGHEVHLISTYPCEPTTPPFASLHIVPLDFSARARAGIGGSGARTTHGSPLISRLRGGGAWQTLVRLRDRSAPWVARLRSGRVRSLIEQIQPDLVHAMRIPFEGILAALALKDSKLPLVMSVWGIDFTYAAANSPSLAQSVRDAVLRADALHPDCRRDLNLAREYGFPTDRPSTVLPGNGGVQTQTFRIAAPDPALSQRLGIPSGSPVVLNPRGVKPYIRTDSFFRAIPLILQRRPDAFFLGAMMEGNSVAEGFLERLGLAKSVRLLPYVNHKEMADIFRLAQVAVSPSDHDGTPNTLLEAMACGAFPVAGNIEPIREWIVDGINGLLCDQSSPESIADAVVRSLDDDGLRDQAREVNRELIADRADYDRVMNGVPSFYDEVIHDVARRHPAR